MVTQSVSTLKLRQNIWFPILALGLSTLSCGVLAQASGPVSRPHVEAELISENLSIRPGESSWVGLHLKLDRGWHVYWKNPGDSGLPPELKVEPVKDVEFMPLEFPFPERISVPPLMNYGYETEVLFPFHVQLAKNYPEGSLKLEAKASWLVCQDVCIPGKAELDLQLPVKNATPSPHPDWAKLFGQTLQHLPRSGKAALDYPVEAWADAEKIRFKITSSAPMVDTMPDLFPMTEGAFDHAAEPIREVAANQLQIQVQAKRSPGAQPLQQFAGTLVFHQLQQAYEVKIAVKPWSADLQELKASPMSSSKSPVSLGWMLLLAILGGLLLNVMPCVFPVISVKVLSLIDSAHDDHAQVRKHGFAFVSGMLSAFLVLGFGLLVLRAAGHQLGWGFQLQSPAFVAALGLLFFIMGLNLLGVFEVGTRLMGVGSNSRLAREKTLAGSFYSGVLATLVSTPCSAPFMGAALGFALLQSMGRGMLIFLALGLGMSSPYLVFALRPALLKRLPRPGRWMETFKEFLSFPMFATTLWLLWVLSIQRGSEMVLSMLVGMLVVSLGFWIVHRSNGRTWQRVLAMILILFGLQLPIRAGFDSSPLPSAGGRTTSAFSGIPVHAFTPTKVVELQKSGKPVFLDFTAAWCVSCQVNERVAFSSTEVVERFRSLGIQIVKADWTNYDPEITKALQSFDRSGVPLYVLYSADPGRAPVVLPEVITPALLLDGLKSVSK